MVINPDTALIIKELVSKISATIIITDINPDGDGNYVITTCNTYYVTPKSIIEIAGVKYKVESVEQNESITVSKVLDSDPDPSGTSIELGAPFYIHGSIISTKNELDNITDWGIKYPMIYLYEIYRERFVTDQTSAVGYRPRVRLFFMDQTNPRDYTNATQYENVLRPMRSLVFEFLKVLENSRKELAKLETDYELVPWVNFGRFEAERGNVRKLFSDDISGYELSIELPIRREYLDLLECKSSINC